MNANDWNPSDRRRWDMVSPIYGISTGPRQPRKKGPRAQLKRQWHNSNSPLPFKRWLKRLMTKEVLGIK